MQSTFKSDLKKLSTIRRWVAFFMFFLILSGLTAFPLEWGTGLLQDWLGEGLGWLSLWVNRVSEGVDFTARHYPFLHYGTDWLAFAHLVIAAAFIGVWKDPVRNLWVVQWAMLACLMIIPLALIAGSIRGIPFGWQLVDCAFGVFGVLPLWRLHQLIKQLETPTGSKPKTAIPT